MTILDPTATTVSDLCTESLRECGAFGIGQTPLAEDIVGAQVRLQWMLQEWERKAWMVYHRVQIVITSTGVQSYSVGPGGNFDTGLASVRPNRIESAFLRQIINTQPIDYPLERLESFNDYMRVTLKQLTSFTGAYFYDASWPLGTFYPIPIPLASIYGLGIEVLAQLPQSFATERTTFNIPFEYYNCMMTNLAVRLRPKYGIGSWPGDMLPGNAKEALSVIKGSAVQVPRLQMPKALVRDGIYNIFNDRSY